jgi:hypothetical protein
MATITVNMNSDNWAYHGSLHIVKYPPIVEAKMTPRMAKQIMIMIFFCGIKSTNTLLATQAICYNYFVTSKNIT